MADQSLIIRAAAPADIDAVWSILEPVVREGETYALPMDLSRDESVAYWFAPDHEVFVAQERHGIVGSYFMQANQRGRGAHVANCGYITAPASRGRGIAAAMCKHSLELARMRGFLYMQYNFVIESNATAVALWQRMGFEVVGRLPQAYDHPRLGLVDALVMRRNV